MVEKGSGKIVFMSSISGILASPYNGAYAATKHAIEAIAHTLELELQGFGVKVATINPGAFKTGFNDRAAEELWKWYDEEKNFTKKERRLFSPFCILVFAEDDYFNQILLPTVKRPLTAKVISFSERILDRKERKWN